MARPTRVRRRLGRAAGLAAACVLALSGCGIHPGQAAVVGDTEISPEEVDETAAVVCIVDQSVAGVQAVARRKAVEFLVGSELIEMFGRDRQALPTGGQLSQSPALAQIEQDAESLPPAVQQEYIDVITRLLATQQTLINIGQTSPEAQEGGADAALAAGSAAYSAWLAEESPEISVDPRFGEWQDSALVPGDSSLSVAVSDSAQQSGGDAGQLPATQVCS